MAYIILAQLPSIESHEGYMRDVILFSIDGIELEKCKVKYFMMESIWQWPGTDH